MERRPDSGLLGGMLGWPGPVWSEDEVAEAAPLPGDWHDVGAEARHTFTHFHLRLSLRVARIDPSDIPADSRLLILPHAEFRPTDLPTVMRKAFDLARESADSLIKTRAEPSGD